ncbi:MAG TPA: FtsQ-type POTRA domain-containing protein [Thermoanaerobaculia bacterium]|nr:FtsQ-type POTRA domain-containing protein [Thermoanaerobaculia bacterium]
MSTTLDTTQSRFLRPQDRPQRNQRRIHVQRLFIIVRNLLLIAGVVLVGAWAYRRTQSDARFAVKTIEIAGAVHTPRASIDDVTQRYRGVNFFHIDIAGVQRDLGGLPWIRRIDVEKKLPDTLRIRIAERQPIALVKIGERLMYVDEDGVSFAELSPAVGDDDLPLVSDASGDELARTVALLRDLRARDPQVYSRISEVRPIAPRGFAIFDRELGAVVYANADDVTTKWRDLYAIVRAENLDAASIEYADLRFADRIVVKPTKPMMTSASAIRTMPPAQITN